MFNDSFNNPPKLENNGERHSDISETVAQLQKFIDENKIVDSEGKPVKILNFKEPSPEDIKTADHLESLLFVIQDEQANWMAKDMLRFYKSPTFKDSITKGSDDSIRDHQIETALIDLSIDKAKQGLTHDEKEYYKKLGNFCDDNRMRRNNARIPSGYYEEYFKTDYLAGHPFLKFSDRTVELGEILKGTFQHKVLDDKKMLQEFLYDELSPEEKDKVMNNNREFIASLLTDIINDAKNTA